MNSRYWPIWYQMFSVYLFAEIFNINRMAPIGAQDGKYIRLDMGEKL